MIHPDYIRCHCAECAKGDKLPARRQGIPGAWQSTFAFASCPDDEARFAIEMEELNARLIAKYGTSDPREIGLIRMHGAPPPDTLPLFVGALEPTLF